MPPRKPLTRKPKTDNLMDYLSGMEDELEINEHDLDNELKKHPQYRANIGQELALEKSRRDEAKLAVKEIEAEVAKEYRETAKTQNEKVTEKEIEAEVILNKEVKAAKRDQIRLERNVNLLEALYDSFKDRGYSISRLVDLWIDDYIEKEYGRVPDNRMKEHKANKAREGIKRAYRRDSAEDDPPF